MRRGPFDVVQAKDGGFCLLREMELIPAAGEYEIREQAESEAAHRNGLWMEGYDAATKTLEYTLLRMRG